MTDAPPSTDTVAARGLGRDTFRVEFDGLFSELRTLLRAAIEASVGQVEQGHDLHQALGIDTTLAWKIYRSAFDEDPYLAATFLPGTAGCRIFLDSVVRSGAPAELREAFLGVWSRYESFLKRHAGDRDRATTMLLAYADEGRGVLTTAQRKAAYRAMGSIWGTQSDVEFTTTIVRANQAFPQSVDTALIHGYAGLRFLKPAVRWPISSIRWTGDGGALRRTDGGISLDPAAEPGGAPLLRVFCSDPLPSIRSVTGQGGVVTHYLLPDGVGNTCAADLVVGELQPTVAPRFRDPKNQFAEFTMTARTPAEAQVFDLLVERGTFVDAEPECVCISRLHATTDISRARRERADRLPLDVGPERIDHLGRSKCAEYARFPELYERVFALLGWDPEAFVLWRLRVAYPVIPSSLIMSFPLRGASELGSGAGSGPHTVSRSDR